MTDSPFAQDAQLARAYHVGLHRLRVTSPECEQIDPLDSHVVACDLNESDKVAFADIRKAVAYFESLQEQPARDPWLTNDIGSVLFAIRMLEDRRNRDFDDITRGMFGVSLTPPNDEALVAAREQAEHLFFVAFPHLGHRPYDSDTVQAAYDLFKSTSRADSNSVRALADRVVNALDLLGVKGIGTYDVETFQRHAGVIASVTSGDDARLKLGFNEASTSLGLPGVFGYAMGHESFHLVQHRRLRLLASQGRLSPSQLLISPLTSALMGRELPAEAAPHFIPRLRDDEVLYGPFERWQLAERQARWLAWVGERFAMDDLRYGGRQVHKSLTRWAPSAGCDDTVLDQVEFIRTNPLAAIAACAYAFAAARIVDAQELEKHDPLKAQRFVLAGATEPLSATEVEVGSRGEMPNGLTDSHAQGLQ